jgi:hypothetical protein
VQIVVAWWVSRRGADALEMAVPPRPQQSRRRGWIRACFAVVAVSRQTPHHRHQRRQSQTVSSTRRRDRRGGTQQQALATTRRALVVGLALVVGGS